MVNEGEQVKKKTNFNKLHKVIVDFIIDFETKNERKPFLYEICYGLDRTHNRSLNHLQTLFQIIQSA